MQNLCQYGWRDALPCPWCPGPEGCKSRDEHAEPCHAVAAQPSCGWGGSLPCLSCKPGCAYRERLEAAQDAQDTGTWWDGQPYEDYDPYSESSSNEEYTVQDPTSGIQLNDAQKKVVDHLDGAALVIATAGSGKTRALTERIDRLVSHYRVPPEQILAVTFTRPAAAEMRHRVGERVGSAAKNLTIVTFHSLALGIGREHPEAYGRKGVFSIWDDQVMRSEMRRILREAWADPEVAPGVLKKGRPPNARKLLEAVGKQKRRAKELNDRGWLKRMEKTFHPVCSWAVTEYEAIKAASNACDYDDLIWMAVRALQHNDELRRSYNARWQYVMVDEYQDTNDLQERLLGLLVRDHGNLMAIGDEDQSIYGFRGSQVEHILTFEKRYSGAVVLPLGQNYRCSGHIMEKAAPLIAHNQQRRAKRIWTDNPEGWPVETLRFLDAPKEALYIARQVAGSLKAGYDPDEHAILVRTRRQLIPLQFALRQAGIPYKTVGAVDLHQRVDVKLVLSWLKCAVSVRDSAAAATVLGSWPKLGAKTVTHWREAFTQSDGGVWGVLVVLHGERGLGTKTQRGQSLAKLRATTQELDARIRRDDSVHNLVLWLYREAGLDAAIEDGLMGSGREAEEAQGRRDLREQFLSMCPHERTQANGFHEVSAFLDGILTHATTDKTEPRVTLSTIHSSKGREWDMGWCPGWCEGLLPVCAWDGQDLSQPSTDEVEEERRLAYVAITRFRKRLVLSWYPEMMVNGQRVWTKPSRFYVEVTIATMTEEERLPKPLISTGVFVPT